jgi:cytochrome c-type biogenesis protein CcmE
MTLKFQLQLKYIIGLIIIIVFFTIGAFSFLSNKIDYTDFTDAKNNVRQVQINGVVVKSDGESYNSQTNIFTFSMTDKYNVKTKVIFYGPKPMNFDVADALVVEGIFKGNDFYSNQILTKCPTKYEVKKPQKP